MTRNPLNYRYEALGIGAALYTIFKSGALLEGVESFLQGLIPELAQPSAAGMRVMRAMLEAGTLIAAILWIERILLWWKTRDIRGDWIYQSSSGNWGYARIGILGTGLSYAVDLYLHKSDLLRALTSGVSIGSIGHGRDKLVLHSDGNYYVWYHVPQMRHATVVYPERFGILTLRPTLSRDNYSASWERIGALGSPAPEPQNGALVTAALNENDRANAAGNFCFFMRRKRFEKNPESVGTV